MPIPKQAVVVAAVAGGAVATVVLSNRFSLYQRVVPLAARSNTQVHRINQER